MAEQEKIDPNSFEALTSDEKAAALRAELYATHKASGSLGTYYAMYPDEAPKPRERARGRER